MFAAALQAAGRINELQAEGSIDVDWKPDGTPVTNADREADTIITGELQARYPDIPVVSEENPRCKPVGETACFMVDPLDGTRGFVKGGSEFTVNIAYVENRRPLLGVVVAPGLDEVFYNTPDRKVHYKSDLGIDFSASAVKPKTLRRIHEEPCKALLSRSLAHQDKEEEFLLAYAPVHIERLSSSIKLAYLAIGRGDIYPRHAPLMEWDIAAGQALLTASGGGVYNLGDHTELLYGQPDFRVQSFVACAQGITPK